MDILILFDKSSTSSFFRNCWLTTAGEGTWILPTDRGRTWLTKWQRTTPSIRADPKSSGKQIFSLVSIFCKGEQASHHFYTKLDWKVKKSKANIHRLHYSPHVPFPILPIKNLKWPPKSCFAKTTDIFLFILWLKKNAYTPLLYYLLC